MENFIFSAVHVFWVNLEVLSIAAKYQVKLKLLFKIN